MTWYFLFYLKINKTLKIGNFDIVIGTGHAINTILAFSWPRRGRKVIACEHIAYNSIPFMSKLIRSISYRFLDMVVVLTTFSEKKYQHLKLVRRIPNSLPFFPDTPSSLDKKQIIAVGSFSIEKGYDRLISIIHAMGSRLGDWTLKIVGGGELENELKEQCRDLGLDKKIIFRLFTKDIVSEYLSSSIFVLTSRNEAFPMVFLEAKACGLPIVSFDCPEGPIDVIQDEIDGFLVPDGDIECFARKLALLIENDALRKKMGYKGRQNSLNFTADRIGEQWVKAISELTDLPA